jgi:hypothetical protein
MTATAPRQRAGPPSRRIPGHQLCTARGCARRASCTAECRRHSNQTQTWCWPATRAATRSALRLLPNRRKRREAEIYAPGPPAARLLLLLLSTLTYVTLNQDLTPGQAKQQRKHIQHISRYWVARPWLKSWLKGVENATAIAAPHAKRVEARITTPRHQRHASTSAALTDTPFLGLGATLEHFGDRIFA